MKQRFSSLDVKVIVHELSESLVSLRLANIYDLSSKILLLKFAKPDNRQQLLIDSGFRCHLTDFARTTAASPSNFVARLRKFLKTRRVTAVSQVGTDRIIEFRFSDGAYRLYLEFFAGGNVILTDADLKIITLLRNVPEGEAQEPQRVGSTYNLQNRHNVGGVSPLTEERLREALRTTAEKAATAAAGEAGKKTKRKAADDLRRGLATTITEFPPVLIDHAFRVTGFDGRAKPAEILDDPALFDALFGAIKTARATVEEITSSPISKGYIIAKPRPSTAKTDEAAEDVVKDLLYEDFHPFLPKQFADDPAYRIVSFDGFNKTVDEFFSSVEGQKLESRLTERELAAKRKLDGARQDQRKRIEALQEVQSLNLRKAAAIEANVERVQETMDAVNDLLAQGMDWLDVTRLIEREKKRQNPVAEIIKLPMRLDEGIVTLSLGEEEEAVEEEMDFDYDTDGDVSDTETDAGKPKPADKRLEVNIKLNLSPWVNAREYYGEKRTAADKEQKTLLHSTVALENAERKITEDLRKGLKQEKPVLQPIRKQIWFEKFMWFISSDGYLVLGGRDAQQNEILYKRYLRKPDVYVHADLHGAASVIIKNNPKTPDAPIPPSTLTQAGNLSVCSSAAWDSKAGMSAWWVAAEQVSKSAPTGEFLTAGSFLVRGKKNFLPPAQLMLGFGLMFRISEESRGRHVKHRLHDDETSMGGAPSATAADAIGTTDVPLPTLEDDAAAAPGAHPENDSDDEEDDHNEDSERANPLQSQNVDVRERDSKDEPLQDLEAPSEKLADIQLSDPPASLEAISGDIHPEDAPLDREYGTVDEEQSELPSGAATPSTTANSQARTQKKAPPKRGQKGKAKKIVSKYKDQDDEDRAIMESIIGAAAGRERAQAEAAAKAQREAEATAAQERRRLQLERRQRETAEHEEVRRMMLEEGVEILDAAESAEVTPLDALVGTPLVGDEILEAIPVCAPWTALAKTKYKAKLQPGGTKKGKAVKEIVERWRAAAAKKGVVDDAAADTEKMWPREVELIRALKVEEAFNCVPVGKVTVMVSGAASGGAGGSSKGGGGQGKGGRGGKGSKRK